MHAERIAGTAVAVGLHAVVVLALLHYAPSREFLSDAVPLMVELISAPAPQPDTLPKPLPVKLGPLRELPHPAAPVTSPVIAADAPATQATQPPPESQPVVPSPAGEVAPVPAVPPAPQAPPALQPAPIVPPNFNAAYLNNPAPAYPPLARRQGHAGKVVLRVYVNSAGNAEQVEIRASSGHDMLDQAARNAVLRWRFVPARQGDQPVAAWVQVPIIFTLES